MSLLVRRSMDPGLCQRRKRQAFASAAPRRGRTAYRTTRPTVINMSPSRAAGRRPCCDHGCWNRPRAAPRRAPSVRLVASPSVLPYTLVPFIGDCRRRLNPKRAQLGAEGPAARKPRHGRSEGCGAIERGPRTDQHQSRAGGLTVSRLCLRAVPGTSLASWATPAKAARTNRAETISLCPSVEVPPSGPKEGGLSSPGVSRSSQTDNLDFQRECASSFSGRVSVIWTPQQRGEDGCRVTALQHLSGVAEGLRRLGRSWATSVLKVHTARSDG